MFDDADLEAAAEAIAVAGYFNAGQDCTAATRVLAGARRPRRLRRRAHRAGAAARRPGCPTTRTCCTARSTTPTSSTGCRASSTACPTTRRVTTGGAPARRRRATSSTPTVVSGLRQNDEMIQNEIFGPVITVQQFDDEDEAVRWANGVAVRPRGVGLDQDHGRAMRMSKRLDFGCVWINTHIPLVAEMPHGGFKHSGYGKDLSVYAIDDYTRIKHVMSNIE